MTRQGLTVLRYVDDLLIKLPSGHPSARLPQNDGLISTEDARDELLDVQRVVEETYQTPVRAGKTRTDRIVWNGLNVRVVTEWTNTGLHQINFSKSKKRGKKWTNSSMPCISRSRRVFTFVQRTRDVRFCAHSASFFVAYRKIDRSELDGNESLHNAGVHCFRELFECQALLV